MDLLCDESQAEFATNSMTDSNLLEDVRLIANLRATQTKYMPTRNYLVDSSQPEMLPETRKVLTGWMGEVCDAQYCEDTVLPLATNILDRFLCAGLPIKKQQLQLLGCVCLLIASKMRQCRSLTAEMLVYYTDNSVTLEDMISWELLVLGKLNWNTSAVIANDFISPLLYRLPTFSLTPNIRRHANIFISLCSTEMQFSMQKPSLIAVASICLAAMGLDMNFNILNNSRIFMQKLTDHTTEEVQQCIVEIGKLFRSSVSSIHQASNSNGKRVGNHTSTKAAQETLPEDLAQPETPTDVQDVHF